MLYISNWKHCLGKNTSKYTWYHCHLWYIYRQYITSLIGLNWANSDALQRSGMVQITIWWLIGSYLVDWYNRFTIVCNTHSVTLYGLFKAYSSSMLLLTAIETYRGVRFRDDMDLLIKHWSNGIVLIGSVEYTCIPTHWSWYWIL